MAVNDGIFDAHDHGFAAIDGQLADNAIGRLRFRLTLGIGVHLMLVDGTPMLPPDRVPPSGKTMDGSTLRGGRSSSPVYGAHDFDLMPIHGELITRSPDSPPAAAVTVIHLAWASHTALYVRRPSPQHRTRADPRVARRDVTCRKRAARSELASVGGAKAGDPRSNTCIPRHSEGFCARRS